MVSKYVSGDLHETDSEGQKPLVLCVPVKRILRIIRTIPGVNLNILVGRYFLANITLEESHHPARMLA